MQQEDAKGTEGDAAKSDATLHKAPSMLWFMIPLGVLMVYALLSR